MLQVRPVLKKKLLKNITKCSIKDVSTVTKKSLFCIFAVNNALPVSKQYAKTNLTISTVSVISKASDD